MTIPEHVAGYAGRLASVLGQLPAQGVAALIKAIVACRDANRMVYLCGNGGSAANAIHLANDLSFIAGVKAEALSANPAVLTCIANDIGYERIFADQINLKGAVGDLLIVLSGSGNSANVVQALDAAHLRGMETFALVGLSGGRCRDLARNTIHFDGADMQLAEDLQLVVGHMCLQWLSVSAAAIGLAANGLADQCITS